MSEIVEFHCPGSSSIPHHLTRTSRKSDSRPTEAVEFAYLAGRPSRPPDLRDGGLEGTRRRAAGRRLGRRRNLGTCGV